MMTSERLFLHQSIDELPQDKLSLLTEIIQELTNENQVEELPSEEISKHLKILNEMNNGHYIRLEDLKL